MSVFTLLERGAQRCDGRPFAVLDGVETSYAEALDTARRIASALNRAGFGPGDHAAVLSPNAPVAFTASFGILGAGMAYVPANPHGSADAVATAEHAAGAPAPAREGHEGRGALGRAARERLDVDVVDARRD